MTKRRRCSAGSRCSTAGGPGGHPGGVCGRSIGIGTRWTESRRWSARACCSSMEGHEDEPRFWMLETIHEYARREAAGERGRGRATPPARRYFLAFAEQAAPHLKREDQARWLERLEDENDNIQRGLSLGARVRRGGRWRGRRDRVAVGHCVGALLACPRLLARGIGADRSGSWPSAGPGARAGHRAPRGGVAGRCARRLSHRACAAGGEFADLARVGQYTANLD